MVDSELSTQIEIYVRCRNLPKLDALSKSDPFVILSVKDEATGKWNSIGQTETIKNDHDPEFKTQFKMDYMFEENQYIRADLYDRDNKSSNLKSQDYVGFAVFLVGEMVAAPGQKSTKNVSNKKGKQVYKDKSSPCTCTLTCEEISGTNDEVSIQFKGVKLEKMDLFGGSDPYMQIHRSREDGSWVLVYTTEIIKNDRNPVWKRFTVPVQRLCNGDYDRPLLFKVFDWDRNSDDDLIGEAKHSLRELLDKNFSMNLVRFSNKGRKANKRYGIVQVKSINIEKMHSFLDYIKGGCQVSLMVAIDFTASNGSPSSAGSLHYFDPARPNEYVRAIRSVGDVVTPYDSDQTFPVWGFGAKIGDQVSHCFSLTFDEYNPEVRGVDGILQVYQQSFQRLRLSGPTLFQQIIQTADAVASTPFTKDTQNYYILLILTDGIINDMKQTVDAIVGSSEKPLSIIIVGVGQANFEQMEFLDGDGEALRSSKGVVSKRDIVQFVPYRKFDGQHVSRLAKETLFEVPQQFLSFMRKHKIEPMDPSIRIAAYEKQQAEQQAALAAQYAAAGHAAPGGMMPGGMMAPPGPGGMMPGVAPGGIIPAAGMMDQNVQMQIAMQQAQADAARAQAQANLNQAEMARLQQGIGGMAIDPNTQLPVAQPLPGDINVPSGAPGSGPPVYSP